VKSLLLRATAERASPRDSIFLELHSELTLPKTRCKRPSTRPVSISWNAKLLPRSRRRNAKLVQVRGIGAVLTPAELSRPVRPVSSFTGARRREP
jgi:hypothetical protein